MIGGNPQWFHDRLQALIVEAQIKKGVEIGAGTEPDYASYRFSCGIIEGLEEALRLAGDLKKELDAA